MEISLTELADILHRESCSCVIASHGNVTLCHERGVRDLYRFLTREPDVLYGALLADKVTGKGAAALMVLGHVREVYADVISRPALQLLHVAGIPVSFDVCVDNIINRAGTGVCPVEALCQHTRTAEECLPLIAEFLSKK